MNTIIEKPDYGNWVSRKFVYIPSVLCLVFCGLFLLNPYFSILVIILLVVSLYFAYSRYLFSPKGKDIQTQIRDLVITNLVWNGEGSILDIGCGSGALAISVAKRYGKAQIIGIDYWGKQWEYSQALCEKNTKLENVSDRVVFKKAGAAKLSFNDGCFDVVLSNLVFHEVGGEKNKTEVIKEALRVLKKGGKFVFQDLFLWPQLYGKPEELLQTIQNLGIKDVKMINTNETPFIPNILKLPFMLGRISIIVGEK